jgi:hypothetical protein
MESDLLKAFLPAFGGALALLGGVFTFVSGRLRDAEDAEAKARVFAYTWYWTSLAIWFVGIAVSVFAGKHLLAIPCYALSFALQWKLFLDGPEPVSRAATANFAFQCALTTLAIAGSGLFALADSLLGLHERQVDAMNKLVEALSGSKK